MLSGISESKQLYSIVSLSPEIVCKSVEHIQLRSDFPMNHIRSLLASVRYRSIKARYPSDELFQALADCLTDRKNPIFFTLRKLSFGSVSCSVFSPAWKKVQQQVL